MLRVRVSRAIGWWVFRRDAMFCAVLDWRRHPARHLFNLANRVRHRDHCGLCADWEASQQPEPEPSILGDWRLPDPDVRFRRVQE